MSADPRAAAKLIFDAADRETAERIYNQMGQAVAGQKRVNVLLAIAFFIANAVEDNDREFSETTISAVAELARTVLPPQKTLPGAGGRVRQ